MHDLQYETLYFQYSNRATLNVNSTASNSKIVIKENNNKNVFSRFDLNSKLAKKSFGFESNINLVQGIQLMKKKMLIPC